MKPLLEDGPAEIQLLTAAVVNVRAVASEEGAGKAQGQVHAHPLRHEGSLVFLEGVTLKPAVRDVRQGVVDLGSHAVI